MAKNLIEIVTNGANTLETFFSEKSNKPHSYHVLKAFLQDIPAFWQRKPSGIRLGRSIFLPFLKTLRSHENSDI